MHQDNQGILDVAKHSAMMSLPSQVMFAGLLPAFLLGAAMAYWRIWHLFKVALKFKEYDPARKYREYHK